MRTLRMAFVGGFAGASMAGNVATLHAAPLPTNVASMKSMVADSSIQVRWGGWRAAAGISVRRRRVVRRHGAPDEHQLAIGGLPLSEDRLSLREAARPMIGS
jgi:hypothetical protein